MSGKPAARLGDPTACPKTGHGDNPIATGSPDVLFDSLPAARLGDATGCGSALSDNLITNVLINGKPAATLGSVGVHGDVIIAGSGTVIIGNTSVSAPFTPPAPMNLQPAAQVQAFDTTASLRSPFPPQPAPSQARALEQAAHNIPHGLEEEEEEEELDSRQAVTLRIGVFFDGTGNNASNSAIGARCRAPALGFGEEEALAIVQRCKTHHLDPDSSYANDVSNVWRLYDLYRDDSGQPLPSDTDNASLRIYVTGIGTTSGEPDTLPGLAFGRGATGVLAKVDEGLALLEKTMIRFSDENPEAILVKLELDIFGFSRGAAAARHFANQILKRDQEPLGRLRRLRRAGKLGLKPDVDGDSDVIINFIGLFDTVTALGYWDDWGNPSDAVNSGIDLYLAPDAALQVVHLVARDEYRRNFALNQVSPPHREIVLPGAHSDLGGGYQPQSSERLYLTRPRSNRVRLDSDPYRTPAYQEAQHDVALARDAELIDPQDRTAWLGVDVWEQLPPFGSRDDKMKYVLAAPCLERTVYGHLSRVYLRVMHALATELSVPFKDVPITEDLSLPTELLSINDKLLAWARSGSGSGELDIEEERLLRQRYIHLSANWNAAMGRGGGIFDVRQCSDRARTGSPYR